MIVAQPARSSMRAIVASSAAFVLIAASSASLLGDDGGTALPFDPEVVSRLSLDGKPRSQAIRQGPGVWLGYDLERATVFKAWQAPAGKPGLLKSGFTTRSSGTLWFEDASNGAWELRRGETIVPLTLRFLGCSHRPQQVELRWELGHAGGRLTLHERVPLAAAPVVDRVVRELRVESLAAGETLLPPPAVRKAWKISPAGAADPNTAAAPTLVGDHWHRLILP